MLVDACPPGLGGRRRSRRARRLGDSRRRGGGDSARGGALGERGGRRRGRSRAQTPSSAGKEAPRGKNKTGRRPCVRGKEATGSDGCSPTCDPASKLEGRRHHRSSSSTPSSSSARSSSPPHRRCIPPAAAWSSSTPPAPLPDGCSCSPPSSPSGSPKWQGESPPPSVALLPSPIAVLPSSAFVY